jgi:hypothetical protein
MAMTKFSYSAPLPPSVRENPPPFLFFKVKKMDKVDRTDTDKSGWIKLGLIIDPDNPSLRIQVLPTDFYLE